MVANRLNGIQIIFDFVNLFRLFVGSMMLSLGHLQCCLMRRRFDNQIPFLTFILPLKLPSEQKHIWNFSIIYKYIKSEEKKTNKMDYSWSTNQYLFFENIKYDE